jgi:hypothetical protein
VYNFNLFFYGAASVEFYFVLCVALLLRQCVVLFYPPVSCKMNSICLCTVIVFLTYALSLSLYLSGSRQLLLPSRVRRLSCTCNVMYCPVIERRINCRYPQDPDGCGGGDKPVRSLSARGILLLFRCHTLGCLVYILSIMVLT